MFHISNICRLRIHSDGEGIRTLIVTGGCPLRCKYCINPHTWNGTRIFQDFDAEDLYKTISIDRPYFMATNGGITFGGGEPLEYADDLLEFYQYCRREFSICAETSLHVDERKVIEASKCIDLFYVDVKTLDASKYKKYTGGNLSVVKSNLIKLLHEVGPERIIVKIPVIPLLTSEQEQRDYKNTLTRMGFKQFECFKYIVN